VTDVRTSWLWVQARTTTDATLTALEMVASRGRTPIAVYVDWDSF
jgi:hypothetical protein